MATAVSPAGLLLFYKPVHNGPSLSAAYESDRPLDAPTGKGGEHGVDDFTIDVTYLNTSGTTIAAGDWVERDMTPLFSGALALDFILPPIGTGLYSPAMIYKRGTQAQAGGEICLGCAMEEILPGEFGLVRRQGLIIPSVHGVTPNVDATGIGTSDTQVRLMVSAGTPGQAVEWADAGTAPPAIAVAHVITTEMAVEVRCLGV